VATSGLTRYFEDFHDGDVIDLGTMAADRDEMMAFARQYDPQPFHTDSNAAAFSIYGGLIASGWYTVSRFMRLVVDRLMRDSSSLGSPGVEELRWPAPVRPGDVLSGQMHVLETRVSNSRPTMGILRWRGELRNQQGQLVLSLVGTNFFGRRPT
jgi:acyl dehydratase